MKRLISLPGLWKAPVPWHRDLCDYYGVTPQEALQLGTRAKGRRPNLPGSVTTRPVSGKTFEELWQMRDRSSAQDVQAFYQEIGAWAAFRQVVFHKDRSFRPYCRKVRPHSRICEYGAGVAPVSFWLVEHLRKTPLELTLVDVPSEHLNFGQWRMNRRIKELGAPVTVGVLEVHQDGLPLQELYDVIFILEVYEHLHNPLEVTQHLLSHLKPGGLLWENYIVHGDLSSGPDLPQAQHLRSAVFEMLRRNFRLLSGRPPDSEGGGGTRCWQRRDGKRFTGKS